MRIIFCTPFRVAGCLLASALAADLVAAQAAEEASEAERVPRWEPHEFIFGCDARLENPFQVAFAAEATGPGGSPGSAWTRSSPADSSSGPASGSVPSRSGGFRPRPSGRP